MIRPSALVAWAAVGVLILGSILFSGAGVQRGDPRIVKIVSSLPRTGSAKAQTDTIVNGIRIAIEEAGGKCGDFEVVYADWDDATAAAGQWTAEAETANARRAVRDPDVMVYIGTYNSGAAKMSMPILNRAGLLMISPAKHLARPDQAWQGRSRRTARSIAPPASSIMCASCRPTICKVRSARAGPTKWAFAGCTCSTTIRFTAKGSPRCSSRPASDLGIEVLGHESIDDKAQEFKVADDFDQRRQPPT